VIAGARNISLVFGPSYGQKSYPLFYKYYGNGIKPITHTNAQRKYTLQTYLYLCPKWSTLHVNYSIYNRRPEHLQLCLFQKGNFIVCSTSKKVVKLSDSMALLQLWITRIFCLKNEQFEESASFDNNTVICEFTRFVSYVSFISNAVHSLKKFECMRWVNEINFLTSRQNTAITLVCQINSNVRQLNMVLITLNIKQLSLQATRLEITCNTDNGTCLTWDQSL